MYAALALLCITLAGAMMGTAIMRATRYEEPCMSAITVHDTRCLSDRCGLAAAGERC